jgi:hypothetical protein
MNFDDLPLYCLVKYRAKYFPEAEERNKQALKVIKSFTSLERKEIREKFSNFKEEVILNKNIFTEYLVLCQSLSFFTNYCFVDDLSEGVTEKIKKMLELLTDLTIVTEIVNNANGFNVGQAKTMLSRLSEPYRASITHLNKLFGVCYGKKETELNFGSGQMFDIQPILIKPHESTKAVNQPPDD